MGSVRANVGNQRAAVYAWENENARAEENRNGRYVCQTPVGSVM